MFMILPILYRSFLEAPRDSNQYSRSPLQQDLHPDLLARCLRLCSSSNKYSKPTRTKGATYLQSSSLVPTNDPWANYGVT